MTLETVVQPFIEYYSVTEKYNSENHGRHMEIIVINTKSLENMKYCLHDDYNTVNTLRPGRKFTKLKVVLLQWHFK